MRTHAQQAHYVRLRRKLSQVEQTRLQPLRNTPESPITQRADRRRSGQLRARRGVELAEHARWRRTLSATQGRQAREAIQVRFCITLRG